MLTCVLTHLKTSHDTYVLRCATCSCGILMLYIDVVCWCMWCLHDCCRLKYVHMCGMFMCVGTWLWSRMVMLSDVACWYIAHYHTDAHVDSLHLKGLMHIALLHVSMSCFACHHVSVRTVTCQCVAWHHVSMDVACHHVSLHVITCCFPELQQLSELNNCDQGSHSRVSRSLQLLTKQESIW